MPYLRPGVISYHVATKQVVHGNPVVEDGVAGVAIKQQEQSWTLGTANRNVIGVGESFAIAHQGVAQVAASLLAGATKGQSVYINTTNNALSATGGANLVPFGRVIELAGGNRGVPTGFLRIDMNARDGIAF